MADIVLDAPLSEARVWVWPIDPQAAFRSPCALHQAMASLLDTDQGEADETAQVALGSDSWTGQKQIKNVSGPLRFIRLLADGTVRIGVREAASARPDQEICGFTVAPGLTRLHSTINESAPLAGASKADLRPRLPAGEPILEWVAEQGDKWEREVAARLPLHAGIRHRAAPANRAVKARTKAKLLKDEAIALDFDLEGVAWGHTGDPAVRLEWGSHYSLVFRGIGKEARPVIERKSADQNGSVKWKTWRRLDNAPALTEKFWRQNHEVFIYQLAGLMLVTVDGGGIWIGHTKGGKITPLEWPAAPLRLSVVGADCQLRVARAQFDGEISFDSSGATSEVPQFPTEFSFAGSGVHRFAVGDKTGQGKMQGTDLERTKISASWQNVGEAGVVNYTLTMKGTPARAPLLCSLAAQFPPTATLEPPPAIDIRPALLSLDVESGDPESLPSAEARLEVSFSALQKHVANWQNTVLPFRPVLIEVDDAGDGGFETLFYGYLLPDGISSDGYLTERLSLVARDPKVRLREPAALVNGRFAPLDLQLEESGGNLYGAQCFQKLIGMELGENVAAQVNGNGNPLRFYGAGHYPLVTDSGDDYFRAASVPLSGGFALPPPFGDDVERWIGKIAGYDRATWFFDSQGGAKGAWMYGDIAQFFALRGQTLHTLHDTTQNSAGAGLEAWPLLGRYSAAGLLEKSFTQIEVWGVTPESTTQAFVPSLFIGSAGAARDVNSLDPLSENQSWRRTLLVRQEFIGKSAGQEFADALAFTTWQEFEGRAPQRWDFTLPDQILRARWGERLDFAVYQLRIVRTKHHFSFADKLERSTEITARSLSATGL